MGVESLYLSGDDKKRQRDDQDEEEEDSDDYRSDGDVKEEMNVFADLGDVFQSEDNSSQLNNAISSSSTAPTPIIQSGNALQLYFSTIYSTIKDFEPRNIAILQKQIFDLVHEMQMKELYSNK